MNDDATHMWWPDGTLIALADAEAIEAKGAGGHRVKQVEQGGRVVTVMAEAVADGQAGAATADAKLAPTLMQRVGSFFNLGG